MPKCRFIASQIVFKTFVCLTGIELTNVVSRVVLPHSVGIRMWATHEVLVIEASTVGIHRPAHGAHFSVNILASLNAPMLQGRLAEPTQKCE